MKANTVVKLTQLLEYAARVTIEKPGVPTEYELTVYAEMGSGHAHYGGGSLSEAIGKAHAAMVPSSNPSEPKR